MSDERSNKVRKGNYTPEDVKWAKEKVLPLVKNHPLPSALKAKGALKLYQKRFGRVITPTGLSTWLTRLQNPEKQRQYDKNYRERLKSGQHIPKYRKNPAAVFEKSNYIVVVGRNVAGFETEEEVKVFLTNSQILSGIKLFANTPIKVKYNVSIGK